MRVIHINETTTLGKIYNCSLNVDPNICLSVGIDAREHGNYVIVVVYLDREMEVGPFALDKATELIERIHKVRSGSDTVTI